LSADVLNQDEIDALLHGVDSGSVSTAPQEPTGAVRTYDFATQKRIVRGRMPTLEMINERFAHLMRRSVFRLLRRSAEITVGPITTPKSEEYIPTLQVPSSLNLIKVGPLPGTGLVVFEPRLIFSIIDIYFGGSGRHTKIDERDFTPTETSIISMLTGSVFTNLKEAWSPVMDLDLELISREVNPHFASIVSPTEIVVVSKFNIDLEGGGGDIHVTLPYAMLEPVRDKLRADMQGDQAGRDEGWEQRLRDELEETEIDLNTVVCRARLSVGELIDLKAGDVIPCDFDGKAMLVAEGVPVLSGELAKSSSRQVVKIDQLLSRKRGNALDMFIETA
jgi:flagellar motor switch protein FliM